MDLMAFKQDIQKWLPWLSSEAIMEWDDFLKHQLPQLCSIDGDFASRWQLPILQQRAIQAEEERMTTVRYSLSLMPDDIFASERVIESQVSTITVHPHCPWCKIIKVE